MLTPAAYHRRGGLTSEWARMLGRDAFLRLLTIIARTPQPVKRKPMGPLAIGRNKGFFAQRPGKNTSNNIC